MTFNKIPELNKIKFNNVDSKKFRGQKTKSNSQIVKIKNDNRPFAKVKIMNQEIIGLLDSGANISVLGDGSNMIVEQSGIKVEDDGTLVQTADGKVHSGNGRINLPITFNGITKIIRFLIVPSLRHKVLFGCDFWEAFKIKPVVICDIELVPQAKAESTEHELTEKQRERLAEALRKFPAATEDKIGCQTIFKHHIETKGAEPVVSKTYYYSPEMEAKLNEVIDRWLRLDIIKPVSSAWSNPLVVVGKPDGSVRPCLDARNLNKITIKDKYPMSNSNKILARLKKAKYFCTFDLKDAFLQTLLDDESMEKTSFAVSGRGLFCFKRMPFGLVNSAASQCRLMDRVLGVDLEPRVFHYLDDIIITAETFEQMIELMEIVAERLKKANLTINLKKSQVCAKQISYLGYVISENGLSIATDKITPILNYKTPRNVRDVRRLIGMASWYRRFIPEFSKIIAPISDLISKTKKSIKWSDAADEAFQKLKEALISEPVLMPPDFEKEFTIQCDASDVGIGGILTQKDEENNERVIGYYSKKLTKAEKKFTVTEKECLAVMRSIEHFRPYIELRHFKVITDHHSLIWLHNLKDPTGRLSRWALKLQHHDYTIEHRPGKQMVVPDALSRAFAETPESDKQEMVEAAVVAKVGKSDWYQKLKAEIVAKPENFPDYRIENNIVMRQIGRNTDVTKTNWRIVVPNANRTEVLKECHDNAAHLGYTKTYARVCDRYWWPKMFQDVKQHVKNCIDCGETKAPNYYMVAPMGGPRIPKVPFEIISMDFKGPFIRSTAGFSYLLVITDQLSKFVLLHRVRKADAKTTARIVEDHFLLFGVPRIIIHDNGTVFLSKLFTNVLEKYIVEPQRTPLYHPQANPTERVNRVIGTAISAYVKENHKKWDEKLPEIGFALRTCLHESTNFTPYEIVFGMKMRTTGDEHKQNMPQADEDRLSHLKQIRDQVKENLRKAHTKAKKYYDMRTRTRTFKIGDNVYVRNFKLSDAANQYSKGIARNWRRGIVTKINGNNRYEITGFNNKLIGNFDIKDIKL